MHGVAGCGHRSTAQCPEERNCRSARGQSWPNYSEDGGAACGSRIGLTTSVWFNKPKPWPRTVPLMGPWSDVNADASLGGYTNMSDIALVNWPRTDYCECAHFAISPNPTSDDLTPTVFVNGIAQSGVADGAVYHPPRADPSRATFDNCVDFECTGLNHAVLVDTDGSLTGSPASVICGSTDSEAFPRTSFDPRGSYNSGMDAYVVPGANYRQVYFESLDPDRRTRRVQPVLVTGTGLGGTATHAFKLNAFEDHLWDFDYTSLLRMSRFATAVELGGNYSIQYAGTPPQQHQITMSGNAPEEGILLRIKCARSIPNSTTACS